MHNCSIIHFLWSHYSTDIMKICCKFDFFSIEVINFCQFNCYLCNIFNMMQHILFIVP